MSFKVGIGFDDTVILANCLLSDDEVKCEGS